LQVGSCSYSNSLREPAPNLATSVTEPVNDGLKPGANGDSVLLNLDSSYTIVLTKPPDLRLTSSRRDRSLGTFLCLSS
jgi:hypothetical protein